MGSRLRGNGEEPPSIPPLAQKEKSAEKVDRTPDLMIFSHTLSQLSYLGFWCNTETTPFLGTGRERACK